MPAACAAAARIESGVSAELAAARSAAVSGLRYAVFYRIPAEGEIAGRVGIRFRAQGLDTLVLDFAGPAVHAVSVDGDSVPVLHLREHILVPLPPGDGEHRVEISFTPDERPLHRERDHLYTLFVPDRARFALPCLDQPDLKGRFTLSLEIPAGWTAVANAPAGSNDAAGDKRLVRFGETPPISTYLFSFAAGMFRREAGERGGRQIGVFHLEPDSARIARNLPALLDLTAAALVGVEEYTEIAYPFDKLDLVLLPVFPYSGMEHPGAILYRASRILLDEGATAREELGRASLVAHETAHQWFGDLVTMPWFDDVWLKEAFAQFMADRIVAPAFPDVDHQLLFAAAHRRALDDIERTAGTNPIRQPLENMARAGEIYGDVIYHKPPVMLRQLEELVGEEVLREGLRRYLRRFSWGTASWPDLVAVLDSLAGADLAAWSRAWVEEPGRPVVEVRLAGREGGGFTAIEAVSLDPRGRGIDWPQAFEVRTIPWFPTDRAFGLEFTNRLRAGGRAETRLIEATELVLPDANLEGLGFFPMDEGSIAAALGGAVPEAPLHRLALLVHLREGMLEGGNPAPGEFLGYCAAQIGEERDEIVLQAALDAAAETSRLFLSIDDRTRLAILLDGTIMARLDDEAPPAVKLALFRALRAVATTAGGVDLLWRVEAGEEPIGGFVLSERELAATALELAVRGVEGWRGILDRREAAIENDELRRRFRFVRQAASPEAADRALFAAAIRTAEGRRREPWVIEGLGLLHHPLGPGAPAEVDTALALLEEVRRTGDIFFPRSWLGAALGTRYYPGAAEAAATWLDAHPGLHPRQRLMVLAAADRQARAASLRRIELSR
ncbi:MAG: aminopeptidase [Candidatus Krumholzibacteriota bacterium]|nr:aminopeptidase [Candidatus Krumholzibacteriota bacterium]